MNSLQAAGYIHNGKLYLVGLSKTEEGIIPISYSAKINGNIQKDGPIALGQEQEESIEKALAESERPIRFNIEKKRIQRSIISLVERARQGDQNAIGTLVELRRNAKQGDSRANYSLKCAMEYIKKYPKYNMEIVSISGINIPKLPPIKITTLALFKQALDASKKDINRYVSVIGSYITSITDSALLKPASVLLADRISIPSLLKKLTSSFDKKTQLIFKTAYLQSDNVSGLNIFRTTLEDVQKNALKVGYVVGLASRLQEARKPDKSISIYDKKSGEELGEPQKPVSIKTIKAPNGYESFKGTITSEMTEKSKELLSKDYGYEEKIIMNNKELLFKIEPHTWYGADPTKPSKPHKGVTIYQKIEGIASVYSKPEKVFRNV